MIYVKFTKKHDIYITGYKLVCQFFSSCRDYPSYVASVETVNDLLIPAEVTLREEWLVNETVRVILLPVSHGYCRQKATYHGQKSWQEARCRGQSPRKQKKTDSLDRKQKIGGLVYRL